ncbi:unnamed protein product [Cyberlindnera jadinii]|uniref:Carbohydrate kinase PfkB domain-containing protein n=1 Tax=Cyberlindnera jadinii (strain ATCC 18201 / CBS 1600 / BCRC 20928 / JCM 3617 / NBRC 0987 / NRRL Y-1542) TaxID=983966 RepID=A0A0H5C9Z9_CYBJN|nr:hypothetical protein CYBJADRAFT_169387 [Cyberlindnera jadinii NRRL Y-1542]ODV71548.1 hypothetical protein CYBJADRAFT_169387 [Cyberlindnera jadinii NRRL Y-1542]CEP25265.1 unnamed protein product [Cyberlindnera jadinii]
MLHQRIRHQGVFRRWLSTIRVSEEVRDALACNRPVVALESTIITHGLPFPENLSMAKRVEKELRSSGVTPATMAFIKGIPKVGLGESEIEFLARSDAAVKVSRRDIPYVMANSLNGGTTISGTMILAHKTGIKVFATGGLGGVHRDGENTMDVSADLDELGRTPVAVVCAGPKSILDIERTMEYLETKGVFVGTLGPPGTNIPGFYTRDSGVKSVYNFQDLRQAAEIIYQGELMGLESGQLLCIPPPKEIALDDKYISSIIEDANREAHALGIKGKELTPYLLSKIATATGGASVKSNVEFVLNNARAAASVAKHLCQLKTSGENRVEEQVSEPLHESGQLESTKATGEVKSLVIGSIALDTYCCMKGDIVLQDSNPATMATSIGGVGYNVALESYKQGNESMRFVSSVGNDPYGSKIMDSLDLPSTSIAVSPSRTAQYISFHDADGSLFIGGADMTIIEEIQPDFVENVIREASPKVVLSDCNLSKDLINFINKLSTKYGFKYVVEPTSSTKASRLAIDSLSPDHPIHLCTPTVAELCSLYESFEQNGKFDLDLWFPVIDRLGLDGVFRSNVEAATMRNPQYREIVSKGVVQMASSLLPYFNCLLVKDGINGVYLFSRHSDIVKVPKVDGVDLSLRSRGKDHEGVLFEHYSSPEPLQTVSNVTGAGDTLLGFLFKEMSDDVNALKGDKRSQIIHSAQLAAIGKIK